MSVTRLAFICVCLATAALALGYGLGRAWIGLAPLLIVGSTWSVGRWRGWGWVASPALTTFVAMATIGLWIGLGGGWMLVGVVAALSAWDLEHFAQRLQCLGRVEGAHTLERAHLWRLLTVDGLGLALGAVALGLRIRLGFAAAFILGLLAVWGLSRAVRFVRREGS